MIRWLRRFLYESTPAEFRSAYGIEESVARLQAATKRSAFSAIGEAAAVGKVSRDGVRLQRVTPMVRNSFKPFFVGRFKSRDGVTLLSGRFGMSLFTKIFRLVAHSGGSEGARVGLSHSNKCIHAQMRATPGAILYFHMGCAAVVNEETKAVVREEPDQCVRTLRRRGVVIARPVELGGHGFAAGDFW
jgi:hypothetical protein